MGSLVGGLFSLGGSLIQANATKKAAQSAADAQRYAADQAAEQAKFRPVGMTNRFGSSSFQFSPEGYLTGAGYEVAPELKAIQDQLMGGVNVAGAQQFGNVAQQGLMPGAQGLFNLGQQYIAQSPEEAAQKYMASQQALLAPGREQELAATRNALFQSGRQGLATGGTTAGGMQATNPEMAAYYNAIAKQDLQLAAQAEQEGRNRATYGAGLLGTGGTLLGNIPTLMTSGYSPLQTQLGLVSTVESLGQEPLTLGSQLGAKSAAAGGTAGRMLLEGGLGAAKTMAGAGAINPYASLLSGAGNIAKGWTQGDTDMVSSWFGRTFGDGGGAIPGWSGSTISGTGENATNWME